MNRAGVKLALRRQRRKNKDQRPQINRILRDEDALDALCAEIEIAERGAANHVTAYDSPMDWAKWVVDNWETIWKAIQMIIIFVGDDEGGEE